MRRFWILFLLLLAACAPTAKTPAYPPARAGPGVLVLRDDGGRILLNPGLGLVAPEGSVILFQRYRGAASESRFTSPESFDRTLLWLKRALADLGWRVAALDLRERPPDDFEARLVIERAGERRRIVLRYRSGVFDLEVLP